MGYNTSNPADQAAQQGGGYFTPGLDGQQGFGQQQQAPYGQQQPVYGQQQGYGQQQAGYGGQQQQGYGQGGVDQLSNQFGSMGLGGSKPHSLQTANLLAQPPEPALLDRPPPEVRLPPGSCVSNAPTAMVDPGVQRCTLASVPTTSSLLSKSKLPLALVINPYRSLHEGEQDVPLVSDQCIARCRRCRMYMNPFVQFIDGGSRYET
jgi:protein transport protein SEC24